MSPHEASTTRPTNFIAMLFVFLLLAAGGYVVLHFAGHAARTASPTAPASVVSADPGGAVPLDVHVDEPTSQDDFTLVATGDAWGDPTPPDAAVPLTEHRLLSSLQTGPGIGLWITTRQNLGIEDVAIQSGVTLHRVGRYILKTTQINTDASSPQSIPEWAWEKHDGSALDWGAIEPYRVLPVWSNDVEHVDNSVPLTGSLMLVPSDVAQRAIVTVTPLGADGGVCSAMSRLLTQVAGKQLLYVWVPGGYSSDTKALSIHITDTDSQAKWTLTHLPLSRMIATADEASALPTSLGPVTVTARVDEAADRWFPWAPPSQADAPLASWNADTHYPSGLPVLNCKLSLLNSDKVPGDKWEVTINSVKPQWEAKSPASVADAGDDSANPIGCVPGAPTISRRYSIGNIYPGQQQCVVVRGRAERIRERSEEVTLHDADVRYCRPLKRWIVMWQYPQTVRTRSGALVVACNRRLLNDMSPVETESEWTTLPGAEFDLAVRQPVVSATDPAPSVEAEGPFRSQYCVPSHDGWRSFWLPGIGPPVRHFARRSMLDSPMYPYYHDNFSPLEVALAGSQSQQTQAPVDGIPACPLPEHIDTIRIKVHTQSVIENQPFELTVPVTGRLGAPASRARSRSN